MAGTNEFVFFRCRSICTGGVQNQAEKNSKNAFRPVPVPKSAFSVSEIAAISGVRDGHRNRKLQKSLRLRCVKPSAEGFTCNVADPGVPPLKEKYAKEFSLSNASLVIMT